MSIVFGEIEDALGRKLVIFKGRAYSLPGEVVDELKAAMELWTKLSTLVGCTSPDGSAELGQVELLMEMGMGRSVDPEAIVIREPLLPVAPRAEAVRGAYSIDRRTHTYRDSGEGWCLICGEPDHGGH